MDLARRAGLTALDAHVFEGGPFVLRWVHGVCFSLWWRGFVGGSLDGVKRSTRPCWTGSLVGPCVLLSRRVFLFWWLLVVGIVRLWGMNKGGLSAFDRRPRARRRPIASTGARRRRACVERSRPPLSLWRLVSGSLLSLERETATLSFFLGRSSLRLCVRKVVFVYEHTDMVLTTTTT